METKTEQQEEVNQSTALVPQGGKAQLSISQRGITFSGFDDLWRFSNAVAKSGLAPKGIQTAEAIFVALEMGLEVGLPPMAALQNIAVINGRPSLWGDAQLAVCRGTGELEEFEEWYEAKGQRLSRNPATFNDDTTAVCRVKRKGMSAQEQGFSVSDAKLADLWGKVGPWKQYPARMLRMRARSFALRDQFGDALRGMISSEEAADIVDVDVTPRRKRLVETTVEPQAQSTEQPATADEVPMSYAPVETESHKQLAKLMEEKKVSFDQVDSRLTALKWSPAGAYGSLVEVPEATVKRVLNAQGSFFGGIKEEAKP